MGSIRLRILKVDKLIAHLEHITGYSGFDPIEDTESRSIAAASVGRKGSYSGFDPIEDTESTYKPQTLNSIMRVTVGSIRLRILKEVYSSSVMLYSSSYSGFDPIEDTESGQPLLAWCQSAWLQWVRSD